MCVRLCCGRVHKYVCESTKISMQRYFTCSDRNLLALARSLFIFIFQPCVCVCVWVIVLVSVRMYTFSLMKCMYVDHQNRTEQVTQSKQLNKTHWSYNKLVNSGIFVYICKSMHVCLRALSLHTVVFVCNLSSWNSTCICWMCACVCAASIRTYIL